MNVEQCENVKSGPGFVAALDQSGGSTPKALRLYGITEDAYSSEEEMFDPVHQMRTRIITSPLAVPAQAMRTPTSTLSAPAAFR